MTARRNPRLLDPHQDFPPRRAPRPFPRLLLAAFVTCLFLVSAARPVLRRTETRPAVPAVLSRAAPPAETVPALQRPSPGSGWNGTGCMERFNLNRTEFDVCKERTCFLFLQEAPHIILDPAMKTIDDQIRFDCHTIPQRFRLLRGTAFRIMERTSAKNASCAWAGPRCGFNHLVGFIAHHSEAAQYRFAITGLLLEFEGRLGDHLAPSVSLLQEQLSIIGPRDVVADPFPYHRLTRPFQTGAWGVFISLMVTYALFAAGMAVVFGPRPVSLGGIFYFYCGDYTEADVARTTAAPQPTPPNTALSSADGASGGVLQKAISRLVSMRRRDSLLPSRSAPVTIDEFSEEDAQKLRQDYVSRVVSRLANYRVARRLLQVALSATAVVFLLFYEIAVVNFLFIEQSKPRIQSVERLSKEKLRRYTIQKNAATEVIWHRTVDPDGVYNEATYPWHRCVTEIECFEWILDQNHVAELFVGFKTIGTYQVLSRGVCENMTIYETDRELYTFGAGWLYSRSVPERERREIDVQLLELQVTDELRKLVEDDIGAFDTRSCTPIINDIDVGIIGTSILVFVAPSLVIFVAVMLYYCARKSYVRRSSPPRRAAPRLFDERMSRAEITQFCESHLGSSRYRSRNQSVRQSGSVQMPPEARKAEENRAVDGT